MNYTDYLSSKNGNIVLTKKPDPVRNNYNYLELAQSSITLLNEDLKAAFPENDNVPKHCGDKTKGRVPDSKSQSNCVPVLLFLNCLFSLCPQVSI